MKFEENPLFLKKKYDLHASTEVASAAQRTEKRQKMEAPFSQNPEIRIQNYLDRFQELLNRENLEDRERGIKALKKVLHKKFVIKPDEIPKSWFEWRRSIGGDNKEQLTDEALTQAVIIDQESTMDRWINYLSSEHAAYPDWFKYWVMRNALSMGDYDKQNRRFNKRSKGTVYAFPELDHKALRLVFDSLSKKMSKEYLEIEHEIKQIKDRKKEVEKTDKIPQDIQQHFEDNVSKETVLQVYARIIDQLEVKKTKTIRPIDSLKEGSAELNDLAQRLLTEDFSKLYVWAIEQSQPVSREILRNTKGEWVPYEQNSDYMNLVHSLEGHHTDWCTAKEGTARLHIGLGDFYVFYSQDEEKKYTIPRVAIRMHGSGNISEVRGIGDEQNLDPYIIETLEKKLKDFPDGKRYEKKLKGVKGLRTIDEKIDRGEKLNREDLVFLYELNEVIEGFGEVENSEAQWHDPHIAELIKTRDKRADIQVIFGYAKEEVAASGREITEQTKIYAGPLEPGVLDRLPEGIEIYLSFPDKKIRSKVTLNVETKSLEETFQMLKDRGVRISSQAKEVMKNLDFIMSKETETMNVVAVTLADLGFSKKAKTQEVYAKAKALGLEPCPAHAAFYYDHFEHNGERSFFNLAMDPISVSEGENTVFFSIFSQDEDVRISTTMFDDDQWSPSDTFLFRC
ncbi:MAG: hypothetical protein UT30_C0007G0026 [Candidatus Uhrbacteria bacterium GW2011_GWF2_39_13]|uniref:Uncharacterized protein n=1 Tax=Candidatus Uhrbacteria bacterium GW2011_GWF2_39_13 TaxID=1618995 RepID=A0A0G0Q208_9BACT|nr:MAG: hypothetical protein UT30_C0007G0026 [Candidatus Uhrbacteria bacterium GW2011_GWF2_39_13]HAU65745.1 hypothetical protein [Candidatus Uhrbacteria bacterium]